MALPGLRPPCMASCDYRGPSTLPDAGNGAFSSTLWEPDNREQQPASRSVASASPIAHG